MNEYNFTQALKNALKEEMQKDSSVFVLGEDIGLRGGVYGVTEGFRDEFGEDRVMDTPVSETGIIGASIGAALMGMRPVPEIMFCDFLACCYDQIANQASKWTYMSGGKIKGIPMTVRVCCGAGVRAGSQHSQTNEGWFMNVPGIKIVYPSSPRDAYGLLKSSIRDQNPVLFYEHKLLYASESKEEIPEGDFTIPIGKSEVKKEGKDATIITYGLMVERSIEAANRLQKQGLDIEVLDLRTLKPLDEEGIIESVTKTGKAIIIHEAPKTGGVGSEVAAVISEKSFSSLTGPVIRLGAPDTPVPHSGMMEDNWLLSVDVIQNKVKSVLENI